MAARYLRRAPRVLISRLIEPMTGRKLAPDLKLAFAMAASCFLTAGCGESSEGSLQTKADALNSIAFECFSDVQYMTFFESKSCSNYAARYKEYGAELDRLAPEYTSIEESRKRRDRLSNNLAHLKVSSAVNNANSLYAWAIINGGAGIGNPISKYYDPKFIEASRKASGTQFKTRPTSKVYTY